jgi:hypothetical protein
MFVKKEKAPGWLLMMNEGLKFGELMAKELSIGDIVEWSKWNEEKNDWDINYGMITDIKNEIKSNRLVSVSKVLPFQGSNKSEIEFFTLSLRLISASKREELSNEIKS